MREESIRRRDCLRTARSRRNRCGSTKWTCSPKYHKPCSGDLRSRCDVSALLRPRNRVQFRNEAASASCLDIDESMCDQKSELTVAKRGLSLHAGDGRQTKLSFSANLLCIVVQEIEKCAQHDRRFANRPGCNQIEIQIIRCQPDKLHTVRTKIAR